MSIISENELQQIGARIFDGVGRIFTSATHSVAAYLNSEVSMAYSRIGIYIASDLGSIEA